MSVRRVGSMAIGGAVLLVMLTVLIPAAGAGRDCNATSAGLTPLTDLGTGTYQGETGGLYPGGSNEMPADHLELGLESAARVVPRAEDGSSDPNGKVVMISIGVSNTLAQFNAFEAMAATEPAVNDELLLVNGAQVGRALGQWSLRSNESTWNRVDRNLREFGVTPDQVQVAWIMLPPRTRGPVTLDNARADIDRFVVVLQTAKQRYPNLELAYLSSRMYGGYIDDANSEPNAYNHGFEMKWLIEEQLNGSAELNADPDAGPVLAPWIAWGPYLWADGVTPRSDGLVWLCDDYAGDGVHPGEGAASKVATMLMEHFSTDPTATSWFLDSVGEESVVPPTTTTMAAATDETTTSTERLPTTTVDRSERPRQAQERNGNPDRARSDDESAGREPVSTPVSNSWPTGVVVGVGIAGVMLGVAAAGAVRHFSGDGEANDV